MKILALITARGGSKRVPGKNVRPLGGKPLIVWSVDVVNGLPDICDILVSTDDSAIAEAARNSRALVPWLRPPELATDTATSVDVSLHALDWYENINGKVDGLLLLQPTSPFRRRETVLRGIDLFKRHNRTIIGVSPAKSHPQWCFHVENNIMRPFVNSGGKELRSQDLPPAYVTNGAFYLIAPESLRKLRSFLSDEMMPLITDAFEESIDIDTEWDWKMAETVLAMRGAISK